MNAEHSDLKHDALDEFRAAVTKCVAELDDEELESLVTDEWIRQVFDAAWRHQFRDNPTLFKREVRALIQAAISGDRK